MWDFFAVNPLEDPVVRSTLERIQMTGEELINVTVKDLNKKLTGCSHATISRLKKCRRTLKNRGYAKNCRIKRLSLRDELQRSNSELRAAYSDLEFRYRILERQFNDYRSTHVQSIKKEIIEISNQRPATSVETVRETNYQQVVNQQAYMVYDHYQPQSQRLQNNQSIHHDATSSFDYSNRQNSSINQLMYQDNSSGVTQNSPSSSSLSLCRSIDCSCFEYDCGTSCRLDESQEYVDMANYGMQIQSIHRSWQLPDYSMNY